jgi:hypothetical protein
MKMTKIKVGFQRGDDYLYSNSQLIQDNVKIEVKLASAKNDNYDEYDDFLGADTNILEKNQVIIAIIKEKKRILTRELKQKYLKKKIMR